MEEVVAELKEAAGGRLPPGLNVSNSFGPSAPGSRNIYTSSSSVFQQHHVKKLNMAAQVFVPTLEDNEKEDGEGQKDPKDMDEAEIEAITVFAGRAPLDFSGQGELSAPSDMQDKL